MTANGRQNRAAPIVWIPRILLALVFAATGFFKLSGQPMMVTEFAQIGLGQGFRILTGLIEWAGALLLLWPRLSFVGAILMLGVLAGAFVTQLFVLHGDIVHVIVIAAVVLLAIWLGRRAASPSNREYVA